MTTKNRGYQDDRPGKGKKQKPHKKENTGRAGKKGGGNKRKRIGE